MCIGAKGNIIKIFNLLAWSAENESYKKLQRRDPLFGEGVMPLRKERTSAPQHPPKFASNTTTTTVDAAKSIIQFLLRLGNNF